MNGGFADSLEVLTACPLQRVVLSWGKCRLRLITYKSSAEILDAWALDELMSHYVIYRKKLSVQGTRTPEFAFRFYVVSTHHPRKLLQQVTRERKHAGVFDVSWGTYRIRLLVLRDIPEAPTNIPWQIFSDQVERVRSGLQNYHWHREEARSMIHQFAQHYHFGGALRQK
ncbi:MAG TPA: hypothetical protein DDY54_00125 [Deltaproteobacteria bacterium]|nr:hypothetical protein [Deltaproteobacteria bacterium]